MTGLLYEIGVALLGAGVLLLLQRARSLLINRRPGRQLWGLNERLATVIVITSGPLYDEDEYSETVYPSEAMAATEIESYLGSIYSSDFRFRTSNELTSDDLRCNLIVIGGPTHNRVTRDLLERVTVPWSLVEDDAIISNGERFCPEVRVEDGEEFIVRDIGTVSILPNPYATNARLVMLGGCRTLGPLVAARAVIRSSVRDIGRRLRSSPAHAIVSAHTSQRDVFEVQIERCFGEE